MNCHRPNGRFEDLLSITADAPYIGGQRTINKIFPTIFTALINLGCISRKPAEDYKPATYSPGTAPILFSLKKP